ncbi:MAG: Crp/Fnr family transcriptional regulator [Rudaea sp.]|nr:Crp/Fnr family transcriptional regulator [Rudaea sp.]
MSAPPRVASPNLLLAALPVKDRNLFLADCSLVNLALGSVLYEQGDRIRYVYFPTEGFISMLTTVDRHSILEVGMIGSEGMCGSTVMLGDRNVALHALTQGAGATWRMPTTRFLRKLESLPSLRPLLDRYVYVLLRQLAQTAACTRFHVVEKRLARWLLMTQDRAHADTFAMTQEFLAHMLGVRRSGVTRAASVLQSRKLIHYTRGKITILNRKRLEDAACACYQSDLDSYKQGMRAPTKR